MKTVTYSVFLLFSIFIGCMRPTHLASSNSNDVTNENGALNLNSLDSMKMIKIISVGHIHSLMKYDDLRADFYKQIRNENPDLLVLTGDLVFYNNKEEWNSIQQELTLNNFPYIITPGNHDIHFFDLKEKCLPENSDSASFHFKNLNHFLDTVITTRKYQFHFLNTNDSIRRIETSNSHRVFIFSHHNFWRHIKVDESNCTSWTGLNSDTSLLFNQLKSNCILVNGDWNLNFRDTIIKRQGKEFRNISVGNRMKGDPLFYTILSIYPDTVIAQPKYLSIDSTHAWYN